MKIENILLAIVIVIVSFVITVVATKTNPSESKADVSILADEHEQAIINKMDETWSSKEAEHLMDMILLTGSKNGSLEPEFGKALVKAEKAGQARLLSDTLFLRCIRSDSLYKAMLNERKNLAKKLKVYQNKIPEFKAHIEHICRGTVKYDVDDGIYVYPIKDSGEYVRNEEYYESYTDLLKEALTVTNTQISDEDIKTIFALIKNIEHIDRHTWTIPEYKKREKELEEKQTQEKRKRRIDSLTRAI